MVPSETPAMIDLVVRVTPESTDDKRKRAVLDVLARHGYTLEDIGVRCEVSVAERPRERRLQRPLFERVKGWQGRPSVRWTGMFRGRR